MSYQVIARKWRPQTFNDITGQEAITRTLQNAIDARRIHHAYLFSGARGVGKTTSARIFAKALNCVNGPTPEPCNVCSSCTEIANGNSLDVLEIDAASNTGVDNVREVIINTVNISPARDRYKIFIIDEVHMLSASAFNALLKTIEEPPSHVVFIMATTELHKVPQTILSRCQEFQFRIISANKIFDRLKLIAQEEGIKISDEALHQIARAGEGSMRDAQSAFDQVISFAGYEIEIGDVTAALGLVAQQTLNDFTDAIARRDSKRLLHLVDELASRGYDLRQFTREFMSHLRNLLVLKAVGFDRELLQITEGEAATLQQLASNFSEEDLVRFFHVLTRIEQDAKFSTQPRFQLEVGLIKLVQMTRLQPLEQALARFQLLEEQLRKGGLNLTGGPSSGGSSPVTTRSSSIPPAKSDQVNSSPFSADPRAGYGSQSSPAKEVVLPREQAAPDRDDGEISPDELAERIKSEMDNRNKPFLRLSLDNAQEIRLDGNTLILRFAPGANIHREKAANDKKLLEAVAEEVLGRRVKVVVTSDQTLSIPLSKGERRAVGEAIGEAGSGKTEEGKEDLRKRAEADPIVQSFLKTFKGELLDVTNRD